MCSETHLFSSFLRRMSANPHIIPVDDQQKITISDAQKSENLESKADQIEEKEDESEVTVSHRESDADEGGGFKTPTSSDHKIPPITECPPAPMKPRPPPPRLKRKASSPQPAEIESVFRSIGNDQDDAHRHKVKKARNEDGDEDRS
ncbi:uncharacterized protein LOC125223840 [Salvia hispanica]|uniref:uncharacterized protein LOC125223840 n=1 Tax=Salvia hispanica TaxID=49212 RepID=UPI0020098A13|nr:uncharacterized protein LOC125223840 [Salvia hispanica]